MFIIRLTTVLFIYIVAIVILFFALATVLAGFESRITLQNTIIIFMLLAEISLMILMVGLMFEQRTITPYSDWLVTVGKIFLVNIMFLTQITTP